MEFSAYVPPALPGDLKNPEGDISARFVRTLKEEAAKEGASGEEVEIEWPLALLLVKRA